MFQLLMQSLYVFSIVLEIILIFYIISSWITFSGRLHEFFTMLMNPVLVPIRYLLHHSIFQVRGYDISPIIAFVVISYMQKVLYPFQ